MPLGRSFVAASLLVQSQLLHRRRTPSQVLLRVSSEYGIVVPRLREEMRFGHERNQREAGRPADPDFCRTSCPNDVGW